MRESRGRTRHTPGREHETPRSIHRREQYEGNNLDLNVRNSPYISCFKYRIKEKTVKSPEYYVEGSRKSGVLW